MQSICMKQSHKFGLKSTGRVSIFYFTLKHKHSISFQMNILYLQLKTEIKKHLERTKDKS